MKTIVKLLLLITLLISISLDSKAQYHKKDTSPTKDFKVETVNLNDINYVRTVPMNERFQDSFEWQQIKRQKQIQLEEKRQQVLKDYYKNNSELKYNETPVQSLFQKANGMRLTDEIMKITNDNNSKYGLNN